MRARSLALGAIPTLCAIFLVPAAASAASVPTEIDLRYPAFSLPGPYGLKQTALKTGDSLAAYVRVLGDDRLTLRADLSALGLPSTTTTALGTALSYASINGVAYPNVIYYHLGLFTIPPLADGVKTVSVSGSDAYGYSSAATTSVTIDNTPPTITLTSLRFSTTSPRDGDTMYFSGKIDGTGSTPGIAFFREELLDADGSPLFYGGTYPETVDYNSAPLASALASSTDGSFTDVPIKLWEASGNVPLAPARYFRLHIGVYDGAQNTASTTITVPINAPPAPETDSVLLLPGTEASRLYMRGPDGAEEQLWDPTSWTKIPKLALNPDGTSVNQVYTKDIIGKVLDDTTLGHALDAELGSGAEVYASFETFMDSLVASTTLGMRAWQAYPYDWRYDPRDIAANGTLTELPDGTLKRVYLENVLDTLASTSATGKVTIIAHSNGGLLAKALMEKLEAEGKAGEVDQLILIGTPNWGTPVDIGAMLHGDGQNLGLGLLAYAPQVRVAAATMPGPYALLPSRAYFAHIADPVVTFVPDDVAAPLRARFPNGIRSFDDLADFLTDAFGLDASYGAPRQLNAPLPLSSALLGEAAATHDALDSWAPPASLKVTSIAGWGQLTTYGYDYMSDAGHITCENIFGDGSVLCPRSYALLHMPLETEDGDDTVVSPSAVGDVGNALYFNALRFKDDQRGNIIHQNLLSAVPVQNAISDLLQHGPIMEDYLGVTKPIGDKGTPLTLVSAQSPANLLITDPDGEQTGILPVPGADGLYATKQDIPGSAVDVSGEDKFVYLPQGSSYTISASAYAAGPVDIVIENLAADGGVISSTTIADIPAATSTTASLSLSPDGIPSPVSIDLDGNGSEDASIAPLTGELTSFSTAVDPLTYSAYIKQQISGMDLSKAVAHQLDAKLANVGHLIKRDGQWDVTDDDGPDHPVRGDKLDERIGKKLEKLVSYVSAQVARAEKQAGKRHPNTQVGIPVDLGPGIIAMLIELRSLTLNL